jgi:hydrogenase expression/formation protein HypD
MKYIDEFRNPKIAHRVVEEITRRVTRPWTMMEICGGQTHTLVRYGFEEMLPKQINLVHGPGCPVCVTPLEVVDKALEIAAMPEVIFVSYGDMLRVPGSTTDLFHVKANGGDVRIVYSPAEAIKLARNNPTKKVVFFGIGFETTAPPHAMAVLQANREGLKNFFMLASHVLVPPAIRTLLDAPNNCVQALIAPGHVCTIVGFDQYESLAKQYKVPIAVAGFEPLDLLEAINMLVIQLEEGRCEIQNQYARSVTRYGNLPAQRAVEEVFESCDRKWRGIGEIPKSGIRINTKFAAFDAERVFGLEDRTVEESKDCIAAQVLMGLKKPLDCPAFGTLCKPESPMGAPMVSPEGACSAYYQYKRHLAPSALPADTHVGTD